MMKNVLHTIFIKYPVMSIAIVCVAAVAIYTICTHSSVDRYYETIGEMSYDKKSDCFQICVEVPESYYEPILENEFAIWYVDLETSVYEAEITDGARCGKTVKIILNLGNEEECAEGKAATVKLCYGTRTIWDEITN